MANLRRRLRFVVICSFSCIAQTLTDAIEYDKKAWQGSLLRHFSFWLLLMEPDHMSNMETMDINLDHVSVISRSPALNAREIDEMMQNMLKDVISLNEKRNMTHSVSCMSQPLVSKTTETESKMYTLLWQIHGRQFSEVQFTDTESLQDDIFPNNKSGLNQRLLRGISLEWLPFTKRNIVNGSLVYTQVFIELLDYLKDAFNFTYTISEPKEREWGRPRQDDPSSFTGLLGMLQRGERDIIVAPVGISHERAPVADFLPIIYQVFNSVGLRKSRDQQAEFSALTDPFHWKVFAVGASVLCGVMFVFLCIESVLTDNNHPLHVHDALDVVMLYLGSCVKQGSVNLPNSSAGRILLSFWWLFVIVMTSAYSGSLIASLTVVKETLPYSSFSDLLADPDLKLGVLKGSIMHRFLQTTDDSELQRVWQRVVRSDDEDPRVMSTNAKIHLAMLLKGKYGYISDSMELKLYEHSFCDLFALPEHIHPASYSIAISKNSPLTDLFAREILKIRESGLLQFLINKWMPNKNGSACPDVKEGAKPIGLKKLSAAILAIGIGVLCSTLCLIIEVFLKTTWRHFKYKMK